MAKHAFTFYLKNGHYLNVLQPDSDSEKRPSFTVYASNYEVAVRKLLKMNIPNITEDDLILNKSDEQQNN